MLRNLLLAYQLENYESIRFLSFIYKSRGFWRYGSQRQTLDRTPKVILLMIGSVSFFGFINTLVYFVGGWIVSIVALILSVLGFPLILCFIHILILPADLLARWWVIRQARRKLARYHKLTIIGITGSYGKTTTKEYLKTILGTQYNVIATPGTHNTPLGVSRFVMKELCDTTDIMIVEMGAYVLGNIKELCKITPPDIAILTGITYQHLERFGSLDAIIETKFELPRSLKPGGIFLYDGENENIKAGYERYRDQLTHVTAIALGTAQADYLPNFGGITFELGGHTYQSKLLARHNAHNLSFGIWLAQHRNIDHETISHAIQTIDHVPHRMQYIHSPQGVHIIDDSFNGNVKGVQSTIHFLTHTHLIGKKYYLTPGLVELGPLNESVHYQIGYDLVGCIDTLLLITTPATLHIKRGREDAGGDPTQVIMYHNAPHAHQALGGLLHPGDLIVFQNDWTDNYMTV